MVSEIIETHRLCLDQSEGNDSLDFTKKNTAEAQAVALQSSYRAQYNKKYYGSVQKNTFDSETQKIYDHRCAFEHDKKFLKLQAENKFVMKKLLFVSMICLIFMGLEVAGGIISGSLAILTDAAHMFSDVSGFLISYFAISLSQGRSTHNKSMGYHRAEILGAILGIVLIWGLVVWLCIEAYARIINPPEVDATIMLITSIIGLCCNLVNLFALEGECCIKKDEEVDDDEPEINPNELSKFYGSINNKSIAGQLPKD